MDVVAVSVAIVLAVAVADACGKCIGSAASAPFRGGRGGKKEEKGDLTLYKPRQKVLLPSTLVGDLHSMEGGHDSSLKTHFHCNSCHSDYWLTIAPWTSCDYRRAPVGLNVSGLKLRVLGRRLNKLFALFFQGVCISTSLRVPAGCAATAAAAAIAESQHRSTI